MFAFASETIRSSGKPGDLAMHQEKKIPFRDAHGLLKVDCIFWPTPALILPFALPFHPAINGQAYGERLTTAILAAFWINAERHPRRRRRGGLSPRHLRQSLD
jgi:hypothetical protein